MITLLIFIGCMYLLFGLMLALSLDMTEAHPDTPIWAMMLITIIIWPIAIVMMLFGNGEE